MGFENRDYYRDSDYTGRASGWSLDYIPPVIKFIIGANVVVFLLQIFITRPITPADLKLQFERYQHVDGNDLSEEERTRQLELYISRNKDDRISVVEQWLQLDTAKVLRGQVWRLITCAFCHDRAGVWHIVINMVALYWFGVSSPSCTAKRSSRSSMQRRHYPPA
jgi:membrane associated rhomboid family serine protease